jgi:toxin CcdB
MAQWDVFVNPSERMRDILPFVVVLQSDLLNVLSTRLVAPLARHQPPLQGVSARLSPRFEFAGESLTMVIQECAPLEARALRTAVGSLRSQSHRIVDALDAVVSGV